MYAVAVTVDPNRVGTVVAEKYRVVRLLGSGGMGAVYEAENLRTGRRVAIKLLAGDARSTTVYVRFLREARAAARVVHPNIVQVLDTDQDAADGAPYIVQEYLEGRDLRRVLDDRRTLPWREACELMLPVMEGVIAAHAAGIVHRDLKPENIFIAYDAAGNAVPKVIDFGIAKLQEAEAESANLTNTGVALGTPAYMSPEQARGLRDLDAQTDVWSLGVVLYELVSGVNPFARPIANAVIAAILMDPIDPLADVKPGLPAAFVEVVHRALDRNRVRRFQDVASFRDALRAAVRDAGETATSDEEPAATRANTSVPVMQAATVAPEFAATLAMKSDAPGAPVDTDAALAAVLRPTSRPNAKQQRTIASTALVVALLATGMYWMRMRASHVESTALPAAAERRESPRPVARPEPSTVSNSAGAGRSLEARGAALVPANGTPDAGAMPVELPVAASRVPAPSGSARVHTNAHAASTTRTNNAAVLTTATTTATEPPGSTPLVNGAPVLGLH